MPNVSGQNEKAWRQSKATWIGIALVALVIVLLAIRVRPNDATPNPDTTNTGPSIVQPVQPAPQPKSP